MNLSIRIRQDWYPILNNQLRQEVWRWSVTDENGIEVATGTNASSREDALGEARDAVYELTAD